MSILAKFVSKANLISYINYIQERDRVTQLRIDSKESDNEYFKHHPSTQNRRYMDRESQYFIRARNEYSGDNPITDALFHLIFRKYTTYTSVKSHFGDCPGNILSDGYVEEITTFICDEISTPFTGAYLVPHRNKNFKTKVGGWLDIFRLFDFEEIQKIKTAEDTYHCLRKLPGLGAFLAMQFTAELGWLNETLYGGNEFVVPGNGAERGLNKLGVPKSYQPDAIKELVKLNLLGGSPWKPLTLMDIQNTFCEFDKYTRYYGGHDNGGRSNQKRKRKAKDRLPITEFLLTDKLKSEDYYKM